MPEQVTTTYYSPDWDWLGRPGPDGLTGRHYDIREEQRYRRAGAMALEAAYGVTAYWDVPGFDHSRWSADDPEDDEPDWRAYTDELLAIAPDETGLSSYCSWYAAAHPEIAEHNLTDALAEDTTALAKWQEYYLDGLTSIRR